jgi:hypothetical protein
MSGTGPAADNNGNIYFATGNGSVGVTNDPANLRNRCESVIRLNPSNNLQPVQDFFTPNNYPDLEASDLDLGTSGVMIIPTANRTVTGCKDGNIYVLDQNNLGGYHASGNTVIQTINLGIFANMHAQFTYYGGTQGEYAYFWPENTALKAIQFMRNSGTFDDQHIISSGIQGPVGQTGAMMSVSSNGSLDSTAILWSSHPVFCDGESYNCPGILRAIDATDVTRELWNSGIIAVDNPGYFAKFNSPVIANGKVYLGTFSNQLMVYGLTANLPDTCTAPNIALHKQAYSSSVESAQYPASAAFDGDTSTRWSSAFSDPQYIVVDLGKRYDLCKVILKWETAAGKDFKIQVADDTVNWRNLATITGNGSLLNIIPVHNTGRYLRMYGINRATAYGYSLHEFEVYGTVSAVQCPPPDGLIASNIYENSATVRWNAYGADSSILQYKSVSASTWTSISTTHSQFTLNNLPCGTDYFFRVQNFCSGGTTSTQSPNAAFSTLPCGSHCGTLPTHWSSQDIGAPVLQGSACQANGVFTLTASGRDIWDLSDQFHFASTVLEGDGHLIARISSLDQSNIWNKTGIMIRESLDAGSRHALIAATTANGTAFQYRQISDGYSNNTNDLGFVPPYWVRLDKNGSVYSAYRSMDSVHWIQVGNAVDLGFGANTPVYCGLVLTSHDNSILSVATIDNFISSGFTQYELLNFTGELTEQQSVKLNWTTSLELNTDYFVLEKSSDNIHYTLLDSIPAVGGGRMMSQYQSVDNNPVKGVNYYRLKMVDVLGNSRYSQLVVIRLSNNTAPLVYPNPAVNLVNIAQGTDIIKTVSLYDLLGRRLLSFSNTSNSPLLTIPMNNLPKATFILEIRTAGAIYKQKLLKR